MTTAYTASNSLPMNALPTANGISQLFRATVTNTEDATYAPDGLAAAPIFGLGGQPLQGNEIVENGNVTLVSYIGPLLNDSDLCWVLIHCTEGALQVAPATQSRHALQAGQVSGIVGSARNLRMSIAAASPTATLTADEIIVETALGGLRYCLHNFSETIDLAATGAGGMDGGSAPINGFVAIYAIYDPATATAALLAADATSAVAPEVYGGANMPSGFTASALVAAWLTDPSGKLAIGQLVNRRASTQSRVQIETNAVTPSYTSHSVGGSIPPNAKNIKGVLTIEQSTNGTVNIFVASDGNGVGVQQLSLGTAASGNVNSLAGNFNIDIATPQSIYYIISYSGPGSFSASIETTGYEF